MGEPPRFFAAVFLLATAPSAAARDTGTMMARGRALTAAPACGRRSGEEILVCGRPDAGLRYRLPLPDERAATPRPSTGNLTAAETLRLPGECAPIGPHRCSKREALSQGLGGGRGPLTLAARLAAPVIDPDR